jgi:hypothetical protein
MHIDVIDLNKCKPNKDFGQGFYVTNIREQAYIWAQKMGNNYNMQGVITEFEFNERAWHDDRYKVLRFDKYTEDWLDFVVLNRDDSTTLKQHLYDLVEGPVADDRVQRRLDKYLQGSIPKLTFLQELQYHEPTHQICFSTVKSLQMLKRIDCTPITEIEDISEPLIEALVTEFEIPETEAYDLFYNSATFTLLADESTDLHQKTWQEIYIMLRQELNLH